MAVIPRRSARWPLALAAAAALCARAACPAPQATAVVERFIPADCEACWSDAGEATGTDFVLDWIVPSPRGDEAPLATAAIAEATARAGALPPEGGTQRRQVLPPQQGLRVEVEDGPAWNGYIGLRLRVQRDGAALPAGAAGYLALVEEVAAGEEGTPVTRRLVRALAGPLPLERTQQGTEHLLALRLPLNAKAERLGAVGWVQAASGEVIALSRAPTAHCADAQ